MDGEAYVTPKEALKRKEFYMLWVTRLNIHKINKNRTKINTKIK